MRYESHEDWCEVEDKLHCSPDFQRRPRYDSVIVQTHAGAIFARILSVFVCSVGSATYPVALVLPLDAPIERSGLRHIKDQELSMHRVRARPRREAEFISIHSIIRGAVLIQDSEKEGDFHVLDTLNGEMLLRMRDMFPGLKVRS